MPLTFILGKPGTGKTFYCIDNIIKKQNLNKTLFYIIPEQFSLQSERLLVKHSGGRGLLSASVMGFNRLAFSVFTETGLPEKKMLDDTGKNMLLRKILSELKNELKYYASAYDKQGFIDGLSGQISEFCKYGITREALSKLISSKFEEAPDGNVNKRPSQEALFLKLKDLYKIYGAYLDYKDKHYISGDDTLDVLAERILLSSHISGADIFIDGYKSFTPQEYKVIKSLMLKANDIYITLTLDIKDSGNIVYSETKTTLETLSSLAGVTNTPLEKSIVLDSCIKYKNSPQLFYLRENFIKNTAPAYTGNNGNIKVYSADNMESEIHNAAKLVLSLCRDNGFKCSDIAIITSVLPDYEKSIRAIFRQYEIPVFIDSADDIFSHPLTEWIRAIISIYIFNWQYEDVFRLLKTGLTSFTCNEIDILENYVLARGIKGYKWKKPFTNKNEEAAAGLNLLRERIVQITACFEEKFKNKKKKYATSEFCEAVYNILVENNITEIITEAANNLHNDGEIAKASEYTQVWNLIMSVLEKMYEILGSEMIGLQTFSQIFDAGLASLQLSMAPPSLDNVVVGDLRRSRFGDIKALIVLGVNDGMLPAKVSESGLFTDDEKDFLKSKNIGLAPTSISRAYEERFLIYTALAKPSSFLAVSYFKGAIDGKSYMPSSVADKLYRMFPNIVTYNVSDENNALENVTSANAMFGNFSSMLLKKFPDTELPGIYKDIYGYFASHSEYSSKVKKWVEIIKSTGNPERLSNRTVERIYNRKIKSSISKLEKYVECPFSYFMRYNLDAKEREMYEFQSVDIGNIFHSALNKFATFLKDSKTSWHNIDEGTLYQIADKCLDEALADGDNNILSSSGQYAHYGNRVRDIAKKSLWALNEHMQRGSFSLMCSEVAFSEQDAGENLGAIRIQLENGAEMAIEGKIDRVDALDLNGNKYVKIIDYKSGNKKFRFDEAFYGLQLQLILYLDAFIKKCAEKYGDEYADSIFPGAMLYFTLANPMIKLDGKTGDSDIYSAILKEYKMSGIVLEDKDVVKSLDNEIQKNSDIIPVSMKMGSSKSLDFDDMEFAQNARVLSTENFLKLMDYTVKKAGQIGNDILSGKIDAAPYQFKQSTGCSFCPYKPVCRFDPKMCGNGFVCLPKISEEAALSKMLGEGSEV